jgi:hypothetical protein
VAGEGVFLKLKKQKETERKSNSYNEQKLCPKYKSNIIL